MGTTTEEFNRISELAPGWVGSSEKEKDIIKKHNLKVGEDELTEILSLLGFTCCPHCGTWMESGEMLSNPEDDSDQACDGCAISWGW